MARGPTHYSSKGACIYCGAADVPLKDEHVVPYSLGGSHVLRQASCARCEDMTKKFEQMVARDLWGDARTSFNAPSRRKKDRKTHIEMTDSKRGGKRLIPVAEYPAGFIFYKMGTCGYLQGLQETDDISSTWQLIVMDDATRRNAFMEKHDCPPALRFRHVPDAFGRLLAKIAYCQMLTALDLGDFSPAVLPYITGQKANLSFIVGSKDGPPEPGDGYRLTTHYADVEPDRILLMVEVRLYANWHVPTYEVIVGEVFGAERVQHVKQKLSSAA
jgi:hypothetical protein